MPQSRRALLAALGALPWALARCRNSGRAEREDSNGDTRAGQARIVFKHQTLGDPTAFRALLDDFRRDHPDVSLSAEVLPSASDVLHQYFLTSLEGAPGAFDVFVADVIWVAEFARAGWVADLSHLFAPATMARDFIPAAAEASIIGGRTYAVPWFVDVGLLFYRSDLVPRPPLTYDELEQFARGAARGPGAPWGYVFQAREYEGLVCNAFEAMWGHGAPTMEGNRVVVDTQEARAALSWMRSLLGRGIAPRSVTAMTEEESRRMFQAGRAVFMRNWPYAYAEAESADSPVRGRVGVTSLPALPGRSGHGALGGWQLAIDARISGKRREAAEALVSHLTSLRANLVLAEHYGRMPPRRDAYTSPELLEKAPLVARLAREVEGARARPVTPYYVMISDILESEFSAIVAGVRPPRDALGRAQALIDRVTREGS